MLLTDAPKTESNTYFFAPLLRHESRKSANNPMLATTIAREMQTDGK